MAAVCWARFVGMAGLNMRDRQLCDWSLGCVPAPVGNSFLYMGKASSGLDRRLFVLFGWNLFGSAVAAGLLSDQLRPEIVSTKASHKRPRQISHGACVLGTSVVELSQSTVICRAKMSLALNVTSEIWYQKVDTKNADLFSAFLCKRSRTFSFGTRHAHVFNAHPQDHNDVTPRAHVQHTPTTPHCRYVMHACSKHTHGETHVRRIARRSQ